MVVGGPEVSNPREAKAEIGMSFKPYKSFPPYPIDHTEQRGFSMKGVYEGINTRQQGSWKLKFKD